MLSSPEIVLIVVLHAVVFHVWSVRPKACHHGRGCRRYYYEIISYLQIAAVADPTAAGAEEEG